jgi:hypothetical protein
MSTEAQHAANLASAKRTYEGLCFCVLPWENAQEFGDLQLDFMGHFRPHNHAEIALVERLAQHHWLTNRAIALQGRCFFENGDVDEKRLALFLRYQTTHERAFHKCLADLLKLQTLREKQKIGFESQKRQLPEKEAKEARAQELHAARVRLANARASHIEIDSDIKQTLEAPLPGHMRIPFEDLGAAFRSAVRYVSDSLLEKQTQQAA